MSKSEKEYKTLDERWYEDEYGFGIVSEESNEEYLERLEQEEPDWQKEQ
jgi:hypothetical protein